MAVRHLVHLWRPRRAAGALLFDPAGQLLLVRDRLRREWGYPGGYLNHGEAPLIGCAREIGEEVGLAVAPGRLQWLDEHRWSRPLGELTFTTFTAQLASAEAEAVRLQRRELTAYQWVSVAEAPDMIAPRLRPRLEQLLALTGITTALRTHDGHIS